MGKYKLTVTFTTDDYFDDDADLNEITRAIQDEIDMKSTYDVEIKVQDQYCLEQERKSHKRADDLNLLESMNELKKGHGK